MRVLAIVICMTSPALAQDPLNQHGHHGKGHSDFHGPFYSTLKKPGTNTSCCNLTDCRPTQSRAVGDSYEVEIDGRWIKVLQSKIVKKSAPDGGAHVCAPDGKMEYSNGSYVKRAIEPEDVYCVVLPPET